MIPAIQIGNNVIFTNQVCSIDYKHFSEENAKLTGFDSVLTIYTTDGREIRLVDEEADTVWEWAQSQSVDLNELLNP